MVIIVTALTVWQAELELQIAAQILAQPSWTKRSTEPDEGPLINLLAARQLRVIAEVAQKPGELPQRLRCAGELRGKHAAGQGPRFDDGKLHRVERLPAFSLVADSINSDQKHAIHIFRATCTLDRVLFGWFICPPHRSLYT
jgi:hypothetical protein